MYVEALIIQRTLYSLVCVVYVNTDTLMLNRALGTVQAIGIFCLEPPETLHMILSNSCISELMGHVCRSPYFLEDIGVKNLQLVAANTISLCSTWWDT